MGKKRYKSNWEGEELSCMVGHWQCHIYPELGASEFSSLSSWVPLWWRKNNQCKQQETEIRLSTLSPIYYTRFNLHDAHHISSTLSSLVHKMWYTLSFDGMFPSRSIHGCIFLVLLIINLHWWTPLMTTVPKIYSVDNVTLQLLIISFFWLLYTAYHLLQCL